MLTTDPTLHHGHVKLGSRVYYKDNGPKDTGTIIDIVLSDCPFVVKWDRQMSSEFITKDIPELGIEGFTYNPADENIDQFRWDQLVLLPVD